MKFSDRYGHTKTTIIKNDISEPLKNRIWNVICKHIDSHYTHQFSTLKDIYDKCFKLPTNELSDHTTLLAYRRMTNLFLKLNWYSIYNFLEDLISISDLKDLDGLKNNLNRILKEENSSYQIINDNVIEITSDEEIAEIEEAIDAGFEGVKIHISQAVSILSNRERPDYRNVIKESILAVESICQIITDDKNATLGKALDKIEEKYKIHNALKDGFKKIYGYTSDGDGIRHSLTEKPENLTLTDAKFMLIACSAFVNYLIGKISDLGIEIGNE
ncbi:MAG: hypothetical protein GWP19_07915 [Planctomycetia bacterium]|nr:hypothetical protein [Planctomycetia bacterium]